MKMNESWRRALSFAAIILGFFMALLDTTIVNVAMPKMTEHFSASLDGMSWVVNGYNLTFAVFLVTASRLADQFGRKRLFLMGVLLFVASSVLAGMSASLSILVAFRVLQGLAAAIVVPVTIPMSIELFPPRMQGAILGIWGGISGLAAASGPTLGGILTDSIGWSSIFYVNVPIGAVCLILSWVLLKESKDPTAGRGIDWIGIGLLTAGMFSVTYALIKANDWGWGSAGILGLLAASLAAFILFVLAELRVKEPMLPLWLFRIPTFSWAALTLFMVGAGVMVPSLLMSYFLTGIMGKTVLGAGMIISSMPLATMVVSAIVGPLTSRYGSRFFAAGGMVIMSAAVYSFGALHADSELFSVMWRLALAGVAMGMVMAPTMGAVMRNVPSEKTGIASGITNMTRALGSVLGVALLITMLNHQQNVHLAGSQIRIKESLRKESGIQNEWKEVIMARLEDSKRLRNDLAIKTFDAETADTKEKAMADVPQEKRAEASDRWDSQLEAVHRWMEGIWPELKESSADAFRATFRSAGVVLLAGVWFGLRSDRRRPVTAAGEEERAHVSNQA